MAIVVESSPGLLLALVLGAGRLDIRAQELANCPKCHDRPERHQRAAAELRNLIKQLEEQA